MSESYFAFYFIDRQNYDNLLDRDFNIDNLVKSLNDTTFEDTSISFLTKAYLVYLNAKLSDILFNDNFYKEFFNNVIKSNLTNREFEFIDSKFKEEFNSNSSLEKYYELITLPGNGILIVVEEGFLHHITESKNNLLKFILQCLCYQYKFKSVFESLDELSYQNKFKNKYEKLFNMYIKLKMNDNHFNFLKLKVL